jgi:calcineurin-like phosphoesterase family protein
MEQYEKTFFTSDNHFGHEMSVSRPVSKAWGTNTRHQFADVATMNQGMVDAWNLLVPKDGAVHVLGDFVYNGNLKEKSEWMLDFTADILASLHGKKHLIVGNHDLPYIDDSFTEEYLKRGFDSVTIGKKTIELAGKAFELCHFPRWRGPDERPPQYPEPVADWKNEPWLLHGHSHSQVQLDMPNKMIDVGVDAWSFRPVPAKTILHMAAASEDLMDTIHTAGRIAPNTYSL